MSDIHEKSHHHGVWGEWVRNVMLGLILAVMGWVGTSVDKLNDESSAQRESQAKLQQKLDDLEGAIKPVTDQMPNLAREVDKLDLQSADHERRIQDLETARSVRR